MLNLLCLAAALSCQNPLNPRLVPAGGGGSVVMTQDTLLAGRDTYISKTLPNQNFGNSDTLRTGGPNRNRALLAFDSAAIAQVVGSGQLDSAWLELTIVLTDGLGASGRTFDLHRLLSNWTELGATWNCPVDANTGNDSPNCSGSSWDMTNGNAYASGYTARVTVVDQQTGVLRLNVTSDVAGFLSGTANYGWLFRKTNESLSGGTVTFSRNNPTTGPRLVLSVAQDTTRPAVPAYGYPHDTLYLVRGSPDTNWVYYRRLLGITFDDTTSGGSVRAILNRHNAQIVGGQPYINGYIVQVPDPGSSWSAVSTMVSALSTETGVKYVVLLVHRGPPPHVDWITPTDGTNLSHRDWLRVTNDTSWAWRAVRAPQAWGCETGTGAAVPVPVGVVEWQFDLAHPDLQPLNPTVFEATGTWGYGLTTGATDTLKEHGSAVAATLTGVGNNGTGIAGMIWRSELHLYALGVPGGSPEGEASAVYNEVLPRVEADRVKVLNFSIDFARDDNQPSAQPQLVDALRRFLQNNPDVLIVKAAGNEHSTLTVAQVLGPDGRAIALQDALQQLKSQGFSNQILIVAGTERPGNEFWSGSNFFIDGTDLAAPAERVGFATAQGTVALRDGTSLGTPMVSGVAAALWNVDPALTAAQVRAYIRGGAAFANLPVQGVPGNELLYQLDAYGALRELAEDAARPGHLPLCGNDVWVANGALKARRGSTNETLVTLNDTTGLVNVRHGGRRLDVYTNGIGLRVFQYQPGTGNWTEATDPYSLPDSLPGGTYLSSLFASHDGDSSTSVLQSVVGNQAKITVRVTTGGQTLPIDSFTVTVTPYSQTSCRKELLQSDSVTYSCVDSTAKGTATNVFPRPAFSPLGDRILVAVNRKQETITLDAQFSPCPGTAFIGSSPQFRCKGYSYSATSIGHDLWQVALPSRTHSLLQSFSGPNVWWLGLSEDGTRLVAGTGTDQISYRIEPSLTGGWQQTGFAESWPDCAVTFRQAGSWAFLNAEPSPEACSFLESAGTIAPIRAAALRGATPAQRPRRHR